MRVLVTGGAGYVGSVSVDALLEAGHDVVVLDDLTTGHRGRRHRGAARSSVARTRTRRWSATLLAGRAASRPSSTARARSLVGESRSRDPAKYYRDNVAGGVALLEAARDGRRRAARVLVDGRGLRRPGRDARSTRTPPLRPINPYGETKRTFEGALRWYGAAYGLRSVSLRYFNVAGATERARRGPRARDAPDPERAGRGRGRRRR